MHCISLKTTDPFFNIATEEYLLKNSYGEWLILYINHPSIVIGKHQIAHREVNTQYVTEHKIPVIRRITGGGTVYHDEGNLNFTFITNTQHNAHAGIHANTLHIIDFLARHGVSAYFDGNSGLKTGSFKISGNAEYLYRNRLLHHGTLLFSASLETMQNTLRHNPSSYRSKAVISNPSPVTNLNGLLSGIGSIQQLRDKLMLHLLSTIPCATRCNALPAHVANGISTLATSKYTQWEWNYAYGPAYQLTKTISHQPAKATCNLTVAEGIITGITLDGPPALQQLASRLLKARHMPCDLQTILNATSIAHISPYSFF
ncbi:MAG: lipoate--protein ligase family protein [Bacteroidales bacterium]|jgi:lipoate-protein ligase A|nr:lipoate--protein ligase family protein [Bacteroidales bacterium]